MIILAGENLFNPKLEKSTLENIIRVIKSDEQKKRIEHYRTLSGDEQKKYKQSNLVCFSLSEFKDNYATKQNFLSASYFGFDADKIPKEKLAELTEKIKSCKYTFLSYITCSGNGIRFICKLSKPITLTKDFEALYKHYKAKFEEFLNYPLDATFTPEKRWLSSYDANLYYNPDSNPLEVIEIKQETKSNTGLFEPIKENRNNELTKRAGILFKSGLSKDDVLNILININSTCCTIPLSETEVKSIVNSVSKYDNSKENFNSESFLNTHSKTMENLTNEINWQRPLISLPDNTGIIFQGTINTIEGFSGVHKSRLAESFISTLIKKTDASNILGLTGTNEPVNVILIDTERHFATQFRYAIQNIFRNAGYDLNEPLPENFFYYSLIDVDFGHRRKALETAIASAKNKYPERHTIIILDTITDLMIDLNSTPEALEFVQYLNRLVNEEQCTVAGVIHQNEKGLASGHATGALGTHLTRKATNIIAINKVADNHFNIEFKKTRLTATPKKIAIKYDADIKQLVLLTDAELSDGQYKTNTKEIKDFLVDRLSKNNISRKEMLFLFEQNFNIRNDRTMEDRINLINQTDMYLQIEKIPIGREVFYSLKYNTELCDVI
ncbi:MAG: hypothetical protein GXX85_17715 [Ignavibacteria bacterium]|nr:hypothetical protein [Ignavibacteria bacterium]